VDFIQPESGRADQNRLRRRDLPDELRRESQRARKIWQPTLTFVRESVYRVAHCSSHLVESGAKTSPFSEVIHRSNFAVASRYSVDRRARHVCRYGCFVTVYQTICAIKNRRGVRLVTQEPLHCAAVESMRWRDPVSIATANH